MSFLRWRDNGNGKYASMRVSNPVARADNLVVEELDGEVLIYDQVRNHAHCLSETAASVWRECAGHMAPDQIANKLGLETETVHAAIAELESKNLLDEGPMLGTTRREFSFKAAKIGAAGAAAPLIWSVLGPVPEAAATTPPQVCALYSSCDCNSCTGICGCCCCCQQSECKFCSAVGFCGANVTCTDKNGNTSSGNCSAGPNTPPQHCVNPVCTFQNGVSGTPISCTPSCPTLTAKGGCGCSPGSTPSCT